MLVTGVARQLGGRFVRRIQRDPQVDRVIAVDAVPPGHHLGGADFVQADIRQPAIARLLAEHNVDTVVHMDVTGTPLGSGGRATLKETNVIGTMQLLGACQKSPLVKRLVVKSSTNVYGSAPRDPAVFTENTPPKSLPSGGFAKDTVEVEGYVRGFARRRPDVAVCVLRFANILGPSADSPLASYFSLPVLPTVLGYDPRLQFVHEDDVIEVLRIASHEPARGTLNSGTFNIAGDGVLLLSVHAGDRLPDMLKEAKSRPPLEQAGDYLIGLLPPDVEEQFRNFLERRGQTEDAPDETNEPADSTTPPADVGSSSQAAPSA